MSSLLKLIGAITLVSGIIVGVVSIVSSAPFIDILTSIVPFFIGAVLFYAFAELLDSVNAIKNKLIGEVSVEQKKIVHPDNVKS